MNKKIFATPAHTQKVDIALLLLRLVVGIAFVLHGFGKVQNPFGWAQGAPIPAFLQGLATLAEFGGGIALILGLLTPLAALGIVITMTVATCMHAFVMHDPFVNMTGGSSFEPALNYLVVNLLIMLAGPGRFSLDRKIFGVK